MTAPIKSWFIDQISNLELSEKLSNIRLIMTDVDGCLTDGMVRLHENNDESKAYSIQDGFGMRQSVKAGIPIAWISGRRSVTTELRADRLNIPEKLQFIGLEAKATAVEKLRNEHSLEKDNLLFFGDDILDSKVRDHVGIFVAPSNALFYVQDIADIVLPQTGGANAFRTLIDLVLYVQDKHPAQELIKNSVTKR